MIEALWSVEFKSSFGLGGHGIAVFETGRVFGGDSAMIYTGSYNIEGGVIQAKIDVKRYAHNSMVSVVGLEKFTLQVTGKVDTKSMSFEGFVVEDPSRKLAIHAIRQAELP
ncbi:GrlR family regulatory protein [Uliginosibacterium sp. 31-12]|uniref:GrlR family regulatory protein n=1 Tax=Uliginosibacterium sp. 31-12 TaxID=3062781 RepID=UPI0026E4809C|nr:GrlR family regulatory protein [Uliginosibacterium sp. 31-12]MDO6387050.1 hypothetical protein [Uliginosibacterium sp. 31-12]